ncbi:MAG: DUF308 domain-containing protein [Myxococcota bacterium]|nr:DUF308 domain-containing protein [Myxococcota bacterium]
MPEMPIPTLSPETIAEHSKGLTTLGIVFVVLGVLAVAVPNVATFAIETLIGVLIFLAGCAHLVHAFRPARWQGFVMDILVGAVFIVGGGLLLLYPLEGELTLTLILALTFVAEGVFKLIASARIRGQGGSGWMIVSGLVTLGLGLLIWAQWPSAAEWVLGLLVGIDLIFGGWTLVMLSGAARRAAAVGKA